MSWGVRERGREVEGRESNGEEESVREKGSWMRRERDGVKK